ncbi:type IV pilus biogenesis protein PilM [Algibacillus agarilyticus]|uniref:type IV pilus biogenesis protein PilM n=1 Tax=Algibacillus agarilyticus TaxID=2234133 RepID=UPI000DD02317|nr:hypothetical protein [Algibacillus agarilyticus]
MHPILDKLVNRFKKQKIAKNEVGVLLTNQAIYLVNYPVNEDLPTIFDFIELSDPQQFDSDLTQLLQKHAIKDANANVIIASHHYNLVAVDKPDVDDADLATALKYSAKDYIQGNLEDMAIEFFDVPAQPFGQNKVNLVAAKKVILTRLIHAFTQKNIDIKQITVEELAYINSFEQSDDAVLLLTQQKDEELLLQIIKQGQVFFFRRVRGYNKLYQFAELEINNGAADNISLEIQRSLDYFESQLRQAPVKRVYFAVPNKNEALLIEKVGMNFPIPVLPLKTWLAQSLTAEMDEYGYLAASAIALTERKKVISESEH